MANDERSAIQLDDPDGNRLHATWSRSGRLLVSLASRGAWDRVEQVVLDSEQVEKLRAFLDSDV